MSSTQSAAGDGMRPGTSITPLSLTRRLGLFFALVLSIALASMGAFAYYSLAAQFDESGALGDRMHRDGLHGGEGRTGIPGKNRGSACEKGENGEADHGEIFKRENWRFQRIFS